MSHSEPEQWIATYSDGSQDLVTIFPDGTAEIAARRNQFHTWGLPTEMRKGEVAA